jgi:hypothetical protein
VTDEAIASLYHHALLKAWWHVTVKRHHIAELIDLRSEARIGCSCGISWMIRIDPSQ